MTDNENALELLTMWERVAIPSQIETIAYIRAALTEADDINGRSRRSILLESKTTQTWNKKIINETTRLRAELAELKLKAQNVILSWKRGDISTTGTALLELENENMGDAVTREDTGRKKVSATPDALQTSPANINFSGCGGGDGDNGGSLPKAKIEDAEVREAVDQHESGRRLSEKHIDTLIRAASAVQEVTVEELKDKIFDKAHTNGKRFSYKTICEDYLHEVSIQFPNGLKIVKEIKE